MNKEQDDLTLVYMWAYKQAEKEYKDRIDQMKTALTKYSCECSGPCALYEAEKAREADMPHMICGWWAQSALGEK